MSLARRSDRAFRFLKNGTDEFFPGTARLHYVSKNADTLTLGGLPAGLLATGDAVIVQYRPDASTAWTTVFAGDVAKITDRHGRGDDRVQTVICEGPWGKMARLVFRQTWACNAGGASFSSARVVLNQSPVGEDYTISEQIQEIADFAASKCGFSAGSYAIGAVVLPKDESRDLTCAAALQRELRFFPKKIVRFDYSGTTPTLVITEPTTETDAAYVAAVPKTQRQYEYNAHPITAVDVYTDDVQTVTGDDNVDKSILGQTHQIYPTDADTSGLDVLHAYVPLAPGEASTSWKSLDSDTEDITAYILNSSVWWRTKHPRLQGVALENITISGGTRSPANYPRIARNTADELEEAGLHSEISHFTCRAKIVTEDDEEEDILLSMDFLTTDALTRTYTWQTGSSSSAGETLPEGLARALFEQRAGTLVEERMTIRLYDGWPTLGDAADGLVLQDIDIDCGDCTAALSFGQPETLSAEDMRNLLNAFRARGYSFNAPLRAEGEPDPADTTHVGSIKPLSSTEFAPGQKSKTTIKKRNGGAILLDAAKVPDGSTIDVKTFTRYDSAGNPSQSQILGTGDCSFPGIKAGKGITIEEADNVLTISCNCCDEDGDGDGLSYCNAISNDIDAGDDEQVGNGISGGLGGGGVGDAVGNDISLWPCKKGNAT